VIGITIDRRSMAGLRGALAEIADRSPRAVARALNRTAQRARSRTVRDTARAKGVLARVVRRRVRLRSATRRSLAARVWFGVYNIRLVDTGSAAPRNTRSGARVGRHQVPGGFVAKMRSGHVGVFRRRKAPRRVGAGARERPHARGALAIDEQVIALMPQAESILVDEARRAMRHTFPRELKRALASRIRSRR